MNIYKGYKYRIYPNRQQQNLIARFFGCCRFVYNTILALQIQTRQAGGKFIRPAEAMRVITQKRHDVDTAWLAEADSMALQEAVKDLNAAYQQLFAKRAGHPNFRSKKDAHPSYRTRNQANCIRIEGNGIVLPKLGRVKAKISRLPKGRILNATISRMPTGKYFVSLCVEEELFVRPNAGALVGLDVGLKAFCTDSNGQTVSSPKPLAAYSKKLRREQRRLSRMIEANIAGYDSKHRPLWKSPLSDCKNIQKQRLKVARIHEKIVNTRLDFLHKLTTTLVNENQVIGVEDLNVSGMLKNHKLAKSISDVSWSLFFQLLEYKAVEHGSVVVKVPTFYPSSQTCSRCGYKNPLVKNLSVREWVCPQCGTAHDRDKNAASNILAKAIEMLDTA